MPQEPKKRHSRQRQGKRRNSIHLGVPMGVTCANCGYLIPSHTICKKCGFYQGREVMSMQKKEKVKDDPSTSSGSE